MQTWLGCFNSCQVPGGQGLRKINKQALFSLTIGNNKIRSNVTGDNKYCNVVDETVILPK